jgi:hypothetical protein
VIRNCYFHVVFLFPLWLLVQSLFSSDVSAEPRLALVIGNGGYSQEAMLKTPLNDARLMESTLRSLNFELFGGRAYVDVKQKQMRRLIRDFSTELSRRPETVGLFYYSGHGMQVDNRNFILPVDAEIEDQIDVRVQGVSIDEELLWRMSQATRLANIVLLDACRNNPFEKRVKSLGASKGLGDMSAGQGNIIGFASEPNTVAYESKGNYSYFTEALAREIVKPGTSITQVLRRVRVAVRDATNGEQIPTTSDGLFDDFYPLPENVQPLSQSDLDDKRKIGPYIKDDNGTVLDTRANLMWMTKDFRIIKGRFLNNASWNEAMAWANKMNERRYAGYKDWLVPSIAEYRMIRDKNLYNEVFESLGEDYFWSRNEISKYVASYISFDDGFATSGDKEGQVLYIGGKRIPAKFSVRLVRRVK